MNNLFDLSGKVALVTGAGRGIGKAISAAFAQSGALVMLSDVDTAAVEAAAAEVGAILPGCSSVALNVTDRASIDAAVAETLEQFGRIDILVNNAGVNTLKHRVPIHECPTEEWDRVLSVDLDGVFLVSRPVIEHMISAGGGRIINIASVLGIVPARLQSAYVAAKAAVINLTRSMAIELAPHGILVNAVAPGSTLTVATRAVFYNEGGEFSDKAQSLLSHIPLARPAEPEEIAGAAVFFASPAASYVTGTVLPVDGGWTAGYIREW